MKLLFSLLFAACLAFGLGSCKSGSTAPASFCDTTCLKDSLKFTGTHTLKPYVYISAKNCNADTITWGYEGSDADRKISYAEYIQTKPRLNKDFVRTYIRDTAFAYIQFNDCETGRGYLLKLPYNKKGTIGIKPTAVTGFDKKFAVPDNLLVTLDRGNIFVEDMATGKQAMMTFGKQLEWDYDNIHATLDSVNITPTKIWTKIKIDGNWKELEKDITLQ